MSEVAVVEEIASNEMPKITLASPAQPQVKEVRLGDMLVENEVISQEDLERALAIQKETGNSRLGEILLDLKLIDTKTLCHFLDLQIEQVNLHIRKLTKIDEVTHQDIPASPEFLEFYEASKWALAENVRKKWTQFKLSTDLILLDIQHTWFCMLVHYILILYNRKITPAVKIKESKLLCHEYHILARSYFAIEELLLKILNVEDINHIAEHRSFLKSLEEFKTRLEFVNPADSHAVNYLTNDFYAFMNYWMLSHISIQDKNLALKFQKSPNKTQIATEWIQVVRAKNLLRIDVRQKEFYDLVVKSPSSR